MKNFSEILFRDTPEQIFDEISIKSAFLFTDETVLSLYGNFALPFFAMPAGEKGKTKETLFSLLEEMAKAKMGRDSLLICMGGGVVTDVGGLAASLYMRGISHVLVPTSLLAQADACVGGKTAINFLGVKNLLGSFYPPEKIYISPLFLETLPKRELVCGLGEIVKCAALEKELFSLLWENRQRLTDLDFLKEAVPLCVQFKSRIVKEDPFDRGKRVCLNLGHTTAHALEMSGNGLDHGKSVLYGLALELVFAKSFGLNEEFAERLKELIFLALGEMKQISMTKSELSAALCDKKNMGGKIGLVIVTDVGEFRKIEIPFEEYAEKILGEMKKL